eukprot:scaffold32262_cov75-Phaeocystis_antarctica.AAC.5
MKIVPALWCTINRRRSPHQLRSPVAVIPYHPARALTKSETFASSAPTGENEKGPHRLVPACSVTPLYTRVNIAPRTSVVTTAKH